MFALRVKHKNGMTMYRRFELGIDAANLFAGLILNANVDLGVPRRRLCWPGRLRIGGAKWPAPTEPRQARVSALRVRCLTRREWFSFGGATKTAAKWIKRLWLMRVLSVTRCDGELGTTPCHETWQKRLCCSHIRDAGKPHLFDESLSKNCGRTTARRTPSTGLHRSPV